MFTTSYYGANGVVPNYSVTGPVKPALEEARRYLAFELGRRGTRVRAISPGPLKTRAASGLEGFELLLSKLVQKAPFGEARRHDGFRKRLSMSMAPISRPDHREPR
jgi:enoyl-[acyl-carrier protein] reductase I